jgi:uncharacterized membrane protein
MLICARLISAIITGANSSSLLLVVNGTLSGGESNSVGMSTLGIIGGVSVAVGVVMMWALLSMFSMEKSSTISSTKGDIKGVSMVGLNV